MVLLRTEWCLAAAWRRQFAAEGDLARCRNLMRLGLYEHSVAGRDLYRTPLACLGAGVVPRGDPSVLWSGQRSIWA